ncbi:MAG: glycosyl transferase [Caulobacteraceae bacterium]|nr:glycosyl transferase [Caulobacteraceae bacterium]
MRILLTTFGSRGDVEPLAGLAAALQSLGAQAVVCAPPDAEFAELLARAGVEHAPGFMAVRDFIAMAKADPQPLPVRVAQVMAGQIEAVGAAARGCDAIMATGLLPSAAASQAVAEVRGLAYHHASFCPLYLPSEHHPPHAFPGHPLPDGVTDNRALWDHNAQAINAIFGEAVNTGRASLDLPPLTHVRDQVRTDHPWLQADPILGPFAPTTVCQPIQTGAWILTDHRPLPSGLDEFIAAGAAPVYVGFGSLPTHDAAAVAQAAIGAIRAQGRRAVIARGWADLAPMDGADDCFPVGDINQQALFPRMAAVIHHGGAGTTTAAARAGAPQIVVPQIVDQPYWAGRVAALGIGVAHEGAMPTLESLTAGLDIALAEETKARALEVASQMPADGALETARLLIERVGAV